MKQFFKILRLFSAVFVILSAVVIPAFADDPPPDGDDNGTIIGEIEMLDNDTVIDKSGSSQTSDTELRTCIPAAVTLDIGSNGAVKHNKKTYSKSTSFETMTLIFYIIPKSGYKIDYVYWNGKDVTKLVSNGLLKIKDLEDGTLKVRFKLIPKNEPDKKQDKEADQTKTPQKEIHHIKTSDIIKSKHLLYILTAIISMICFALTFISKRKMRYLRKK